MKKIILAILVLTMISQPSWAGGCCGNGKSGGPTANGSTPGPTPPPVPSPTPNDDKGDPVNPYSGNESRHIEELPLWGAVGGTTMNWARFANSRTSAGATLFGLGHNWRHEFQWEFTKTGNDSLGREQMQLIYPDGATYRFSKISPTQWAANGTLTDRLEASGNDFILKRTDASQFFFKQYLKGTKPYYLMISITDVAKNVSTLEYNTANQVTKVIEPAGRFFKVSYSTLSANKVDFTTLGTSAVAPSTGQWVEVLSNSTKAYRYVKLTAADLSYGNIAEVEFYDDLGNKLSGTVISPDSLAQANKAFDGDVNTGFVSVAQSGSFLGLDLGTAKKIGKVRFLSITGKEGLQKPTGHHAIAPMLQGANQAPISLTVISKVETSDGRSLQYNYTNFNDPTVPYVFPTLTSVSYGDGTASNYKYAQTFPGQRPLVVEWDDARYGMKQNRYRTVYYTDIAGAPLGMVESQVNIETGNKIIQFGVYAGNEHKPSVVYADGATSHQEMTYPAGQTTIAMTSEYDTQGNKTSYTYGADGYMSKETDALGRTFSYVWSPAGNPLSITYPDGGVEKWTRNEFESVLTHTDPLGRVTTYTRDSRNLVTRIDYPDATFETFVYNSFAQVTESRMRNGAVQHFTYDLRGMLTKSSDALGNVTTYGYDSSDRRISVTDSRGNTTQTIYDERGLVLKVINADGTFKSFTYNKYGDVLTGTNELGNQSQFKYDVFRRVIESTDALGRKAKTNYVVDLYDENPLEVILPSGKKTTFKYDYLWNLLSTTVAAGTAEAATTTMTYDKMNNLLTVTDPMGKVSTMTYDNRNRKATQKDPLGNVTSWTYDLVGNPITVTDALGRVSSNVYDVMNRVITTTDAKNQSTTYFYDLSGNMIKMVDAKGNAYQNTFDLLNRKTSMIYPDNSKEFYGYDARSNMVSYTARNGAIRTAIFDNRNRETSSTWSDGTDGATRTFDAASRLLTSSNSVSTISYTYDIANQPLSETTTVSGQVRTLNYAYGQDGTRSSVTYPGGTVVSYDYTNRNQVAAIYEDGGAPMASFTYNLNGIRTTKALENGVTTSYDFDGAFRLTGISDKKGATTLLSTFYTLNAVGNRTAKTQEGKTETYGFDAIDQVTSVSYTGGSASTRSVNYNYDAAGNRTSVVDNGTTQNYSTNNLNQYTTVFGSSLGYDGNGNLTNGGTIQSGLFVYDAQNRLLKATVGSNVIDFAYDSKNRVVKRTLNGVPTFLIYDGWSLVEERTSTGSVSARYVHGTSIDEILAKTDATGAVYYHQDGLGSTTLLTDSTGLTVEKYSYDIFGKATITSPSNSLQPNSLFGNRFMFTGREWLKEVSLYDYRNRVYSQELGRFLQTDPIGFSGGDSNIYRYCGNRVNNCTDAMGLMASTAKPLSLEETKAVIKRLRESYTSKFNIKYSNNPNKNVHYGPIPPGTILFAGGGGGGGGFKGGGLKPSRGPGGNSSKDDLGDGYDSYETESRDDPWNEVKWDFDSNDVMDSGVVLADGGGWTDRFEENLNDNLIYPGSATWLLLAGLWPKSLSPSTGGRPAMLGSKNPLTSVPRAAGMPGSNSGIVRGGAAVVGVMTVAVAGYNTGVVIGSAVAATLVK